jgi:hypothetical protein
VAHTCNPTYSGGDQEDQVLKPAQENSLQDPIIKKKKKADEVVQGIGPEFKPQYCKRKKRASDLPGRLAETQRVACGWN